MFSQKDLQQLVDFRGDAQVLSIYLNTDLSQQSKEQCKLILREKLHEVADKSLEEDVQRVEQYLDYEYDWKGRGTAIFTSQRQDFWRAFLLQVPVINRVFVAERPYIKPLTDLLDEHKPYSIVLLDRESVRLFVVQLGEIRESEQVFGEIVKRHKQGGWSQATLQRHTDMQVLHNLKIAAEATTEFCRLQACEGLVLAGSEDTLAQFAEQLPKQWQKRVIGTIQADMNATSDELLRRAQQIVQASHRKQEVSLIKQMITNAAKGEAGVMGLADTVYAIREGRVQILLAEQGYEAPGALCPHCGYVAAVQGQKCLFCGSEMQPVSNAVDLATQKTLESGGQVRVVADDADLAQAGHIGAILRY